MPVFNGLASWSSSKFGPFFVNVTMPFGVLESRSLLAAWHRHTLGLAASLFFALAWTLALLARG